MFINIWFEIQRLNKYTLYANMLSKGVQATQCVKRDEIYKWKHDMDTNLSSCVPKANVNHTISGLGTGISTLDESVTTPRTTGQQWVNEMEESFLLWLYKYQILLRLM